MLGRKGFHYLGLALMYDTMYRISNNSGLEITIYKPYFNNDFMEPRKRDRDFYPMTKDDFSPLSELQQKQREGKFLTPGEKQRIIKDAEETRKKRQAQNKKKR